MVRSNSKKRGLASADAQTRQRVAQSGGNARAQDSDVRSGELGRKGGQATKQKHGRGFYQLIGKKGGEARARDSDVKSGELGRQGAAARWGQNKDELKDFWEY